MADARPLAVLDLDGVISDARHRLHLVTERPKDYERFYALVGDDPVLPVGRELAVSLAQRCDLVYLTGRRETCRADTIAWLGRHDLPPGRLVMRRGSDYRAAAALKLACLQALGGPVAVVVDDDPRVCEALAAAGYFVIEAGWARADGA